MARNYKKAFTVSDNTRWPRTQGFLRDIRKRSSLRLSAFALAIALPQALVFAQSPPANFSTIVNVDSPANSIGNDQSIGSDVQLNLFEGGTIGEGFNAGEPDGSGSNVEVNIFGGTIGADSGVFGPDFGLSAESGTTINVFDGQFLGSFFSDSLISAGGSTANIFGGNFEGGLALGGNTFIAGGNFEDNVMISGSSTDISAGTFDLLLLSGDGLVDISGGAFSSLSTSSQTNFSGGIFGTLLAFEEFNIFGTEFFLDGNLIDLELGDTLIVDQRDVTLSGVYADGSSFELNPVVGEFDTNIAGLHSFFDGSQLTIQRVAVVPEPSTVGIVSIAVLLLVGRRRRP